MELALYQCETVEEAASLADDRMTESFHATSGDSEIASDSAFSSARERAGG